MECDWKCHLQKMWDFLQTYPYLFGGLALVLILWLLRKNYKLRHKLIQSTNNECGALYISQKALVRIIASTVTHCYGWYVAKIKVFCKKQNVRVKLYVKVHPDVIFEEASIPLQENVQQTLMKYLGVGKVVQVDIILLGVLAGKAAKKEEISNSAESLETE